MKSEWCSDEIFDLRSQMKLNPSFSPAVGGFHHEVISSTKGGFNPFESVGSANCGRI